MNLKNLSKITDNTSELIEGGEADGMSYRQIAEKGEVTVEFILEQVIDGMIVEAEHTDDPTKAREIAMDHLFESPHYYIELREMEENL